MNGNAKQKLISDIPVMILCGGQGTRLRDVTELLPKPMVTIGEQPILWHIMKHYAAFGVRRFILCLGYKQEVIVDYFMNFHLHLSDATLCLGHDSGIQFNEKIQEADWLVTLARTGLDSLTGKRVAIASKYLLPEDQDFFLTYGDGLCDVNLAEMYQVHKQSAKMLTIAAVHPPARYGEMVLDGNDVKSFSEKAPETQSYINGGFMVVRKDFLKKYLSDGKNEYLEQSPIRNAVADGEVNAFRHEGFWQCMDTPREYTMLNEMWNRGNAPWTKYWE